MLFKLALKITKSLSYITLPIFRITVYPRYFSMVWLYFLFLPFFAATLLWFVYTTCFILYSFYLNISFLYIRFPIEMLTQWEKEQTKMRERIEKNSKMQNWMTSLLVFYFTDSLNSTESLSCSLIALFEFLWRLSMESRVFNGHGQKISCLPVRTKFQTNRQTFFRWTDGRTNAFSVDITSKTIWIKHFYIGLSLPQFCAFTLLFVC